MEHNEHNEAPKEYLAEIGKYPLLSKDEEENLGRLARKGDKVARATMIRSNTRLVIAVARHFTHSPGLSFEEMIAEGNLGLIKAVDKFDPSMGTRFSTHAHWWIKQAIRRAIANKAKAIRVPAYMGDVLRKKRRARATLTQELCREPSEAEVDERLELSPLQRKNSGKAGASCVTGSTRDDGDDEGNDPLEGQGDEERQPPPVDDPLDVPLAIHFALTDSERVVMMGRFGAASQSSLDEVGKVLGVTRERTRQIEEQAIEKVRLFLEAREKEA